MNSGELVAIPFCGSLYSGASQDKCLAGQKTHKANGFGNEVDDLQDKCSYGRASQDECFPFCVPASCLLVFKCFSMMFKKLKFFLLKFFKSSAQYVWL